MIFDVLMFALVAGAYTLWGVDAINTYHNNKVYADCDLEKGLLIGKHNFILKAYDNDVKIVHITNKICFNHDCKETKQDVTLVFHEKYISKMNYTFYQLPKLPPGLYTYKITTDTEGYMALHSEKLCRFSIK